MSEFFTFEDLNKAHKALKNAHCPSVLDYDTHTNLVNNEALIGVDLAAGEDRSVVVQTVFHPCGIYKVLGLNEIKTNCKYYSAEHLLFCAVNTKCQNCADYCPEQ